ncbi:MAG: hypothetical protein QG604_442 [Candidatus Dependentiae bacterium]|nr:hypothetical protein [Candidatus Dependentiae bacterium]MDQ5941132.1 hypothetical protein [Candidatus Dependentiae bacterium]
MVSASFLFSSDGGYGAIVDLKESSRDSFVYGQPAAPVLQNMSGLSHAASQGKEDAFCGDRGCCKVFYVCGDCLERHRDRLPCSVLVRYGLMCAQCPCNVTAEERSRMEASAAEMRDGAESGSMCALLCDRESCGHPNDYHCNGRIVKHHCVICVADGAFVAAVATLCICLC